MGFFNEGEGGFPRIKKYKKNQKSKRLLDAWKNQGGNHFFNSVEDLSGKLIDR